MKSVGRTLAAAIIMVAPCAQAELEQTTPEPWTHVASNPYNDVKHAENKLRY